MSLYQNHPTFEETVLQGEDSVRNMIQTHDVKEREVKKLKKKMKWRGF